MPKIAILIAIALVFFTVSNSFAVEPEIMEVTEFEFIEATDLDILVPWVSSDGLTKRGGKLKSVEQIMCGPSNGLPSPKECLFEGQ